MSYIAEFSSHMSEIRRGYGSNKSLPSISGMTCIESIKHVINNLIITLSKEDNSVCTYPNLQFFKLQFDNVVYEVQTEIMNFI